MVVWLELTAMFSVNGLDIGLSVRVAGIFVIGIY